jgi:DNA-binding LacI/PurR family transcriptional regulator
LKELTIREIAKMAGVSPTAVSFVLNGKKGVSDQTRKKVEEIIRQTGFKPNVNSRRLFFKKSFNIAIVIKQTSSPFNDLFYFEITKGVMEKSKEAGYNVVFTEIMPMDNSFTLPEVILNRDADGIIFYQDTDQRILSQVDKLDIPYVVVDAHTTSQDFTWVTSDWQAGAYKATKFLLDNGHRDIGFIGSSFIPDYYVQAFTGFKNALDEGGLAINPAWMEITALDEETAYGCMERILDTKSRPTAMFCAGDIFAIGAMKCVKDRGIAIPEDISFISMDDILLSRYIEPALTTIGVDKVKMGILAVELLLKKMDGQNPESILVPTDEIVIRQSVKVLK